MKRLSLLLMTLLACGVLWAKDAAPLAEDEAVEKRLIAISEEMRCLVCQNESLAGSRADLAEDLRRELRTLIKEGKTEAEAVAAKPLADLDKTWADNDQAAANFVKQVYNSFKRS